MSKPQKPQKSQASQDPQTIVREDNSVKVVDTTEKPQAQKTVCVRIDAALVQNEYKRRCQALVDEKNEELRKVQLEGCKLVGPAVQERDRRVTAARMFLDKNVNSQRNEMNQKLTRAKRLIIGRYEKVIGELTASYNALRDEEHAKTKIVLNEAESKVEEKTAAFKTSVENGLRKITEWREGELQKLVDEYKAKEKAEEEAKAEETKAEEVVVTPPASEVPALA